MPSNFGSLTRFERHKQLLKLQRMLNLELWDEFNRRKHEPRKLGEYLAPFIDGLINSLTEYGYRFDYGGSTDFGNRLFHSLDVFEQDGLIFSCEVLLGDQLQHWTLPYHKLSISKKANSRLANDFRFPDQ